MPVLVWIDRNHARLLEFSRTPPTEQNLQNSTPGSNRFLEALSKKLEDASRILIVGPGVSKYRFYAYVRETAPQIARKVVGCENLEHPHDFLLRSLAEKHLGIVPNTPGVC
jgi:stalled ribosome rescue protein Dom34